MVMKKFKYQRYAALFAIMIVLGSCKKAERYYQKLDAQPEVRSDYQAVYGVGDTLKLTGRLNPQNNLEIRIGGIKANIESINRLPVPRDTYIVDTLEIAKIVISQEMGIGANRKIEVTSGGNTVQAPSIQIVEGIESGILPAAVKLIKHADMMSGAIPLFCQNGKGSIYLYRPDKSVVRIDKLGALTTLFKGIALTDQNGQFSITAFNSGGVDPTERYLYFSAITTDGNADNIANGIYRLCRYDLQSKVLTTLNRSIYPNAVTERTITAYTPFEGNIGSAKLFAINGIYPDSKGNIFLNLTSSISIARISNNGQLKYLIRAQANLPVIYNSLTGNSYSSDEVSRMLPGVVLAKGLAAFRAIMPDESTLYIMAGAFADNIRQIDLNNAVEVYGFTPKYVPAFYGGGIPFISGTFDILTGSYETSNPPGLFGYLPLPGAKVLLLYYQGLDNRMYPALGTLNFGERTGRRYAPGKLLINGYVFNTGDKMLNYDEDGMVYMTANNNTTIIKTTNQ